MTKKELRSGDWIEYRNGKKRMVLIRENFEESVLVNYNGYMPLKNYNNDLTCDGGDNECDIVKVWRKEGVFTSYVYDGRFIGNDTLIWERKEVGKVKEMTMKEVCKELGYEVKIIK